MLRILFDVTLLKQKKAVPEPLYNYFLSTLIFFALSQNKFKKFKYAIRYFICSFVAIIFHFSDFLYQYKTSYETNI